MKAKSGKRTAKPFTMLPDELSKKALDLASVELVRDLMKLSEEASPFDYKLRDACRAASIALLTVRDVMNREGEPLERWSNLARIANEHICTRLGREAARRMLYATDKPGTRDGKPMREKP